MNIDYSQLITADAKAAVEAAQADATRQLAAAAYLTATDWYVTRFSETGVPIPEDVLAERKVARSCFN